MSRGSASIRAAVARSRKPRLRALERRLLARLAFPRRHDRDEYNARAFPGRRVVARQSRGR